jgi:hypothetical protein
MKGSISIPAHQVSPSLRALFDMNQPLAIRCFAVLDGAIRGQIWTDDLAQPTWGAVQEAAFGTLFLGGRPEASLVHELVTELRQERDVALVLWPDHSYNQLLPPAPDFDGWEAERQAARAGRAGPRRRCGRAGREPGGAPSRRAVCPTSAWAARAGRCAAWFGPPRQRQQVKCIYHRPAPSRTALTRKATPVASASVLSRFR